MKKIKLVRLIHRICSIIMACVVFNQFNFFDGELAEQTSFLLLLGLWLVFGITISMPIAGVGFLYILLLSIRIEGIPRVPQ